LTFYNITSLRSFFKVFRCAPERIAADFSPNDLTIPGSRLIFIICKKT